VVFLAGCLAAADAPFDLDKACEELKSFEHGQSRVLVNKLELELGRAAKDTQLCAQVAAKLAAVMNDAKSTQTAKLFACQQLRTLGSAAQVPLLVAMLNNPETVEMARGTLQSIPGEESLAALREALKMLKGREQLGVVNSLGLRRDAKSAGAIAKLAGDGDALLAATAIEALGKIGTAEAAEALLKAQAPAKGEGALQDAQLRCAELLAAANDNAGAAALYQQIWSSQRPGLWRLAGLSGLVKVAKDKAAPLVLEALGSNDAAFQAAAVRLTRDLPGEKITAALVERLGKMDVAGQVLLVGVLGERGDKSAFEAVAKLADAQDANVRVAAITALASLGDAATAERLAKLAAAEKGAVQLAARQALGKLAAQGTDERLLADAEKGDAGVRVEVIQALAARRTSNATPVLVKCVADTDANIRAAAVEALAVVGAPESYPTLIAATVAGSVPAETSEKALLAVSARLADQPARLNPVLAALKDAPPAARASFLRVLRSLSGPEALAAVRVALNDADATVKDAAVRALADWADESPIEDLLKLIKEAPENVHRVLALRGYIRLARGTKGGPEQQLRLFQQVQQAVTTPDAKKLLLAGLADTAQPGALQVAGSMLGDEGVQAEARLAVLKIAGALAKADQAAASAAVEKLIETTKTPLAGELRGVVEIANKPAVNEQAALQHDAKRSEDLKKNLAKRAPAGFTLASYLDCGPDTADGAKDGPALKAGAAQTWFWPESDKAAHFRFGTVFYGSEVSFAATGLNPKKAYQVGFSWWDFDGNGRVQSVWLAPGKGGEFKPAVKATPLPDGQQLPAEMTVSVPASLYADGSLRIAFRREGKSNAVVSEFWLWEGAEGSAKEGPVEVRSETKAAPSPAAGRTSAPAAEAPIKDNVPLWTAPVAKKNAEKKIVIVTGNEYPGHPWKETAPALADILDKDPRLEVRVVTDVMFLASPELKQYDAIVLNYMNWKTPDPGEAVHKGLKEFVESGKGFVLVHFACGAFQDWPEFVQVAGRVWNPKMRGHDPFGTFTVEITNAEHPITKGLKNFETKDELYTCLDGATPMEIIAKATSKVDKKDYPMAFVLNCGKGRVFHCVLGHDKQAVVNPPVAELYRRGTQWAAGLEPGAEKR
jgi:type 1 glutamine amidotransferase/HEAT repeat protein